MSADRDMTSYEARRCETCGVIYPVGQSHNCGNHASVTWQQPPRVYSTGRNPVVSMPHCATCRCGKP